MFLEMAETTTVFMRFEVRDFDSWTKKFAAYSDERRKTGWLGADLFQDTDAPNVVVGIFRWSSLEGAKAYIDAMQFKAKMMESGVVGVPEIRIVQPVGAEDVGS